MAAGAVAIANPYDDGVGHGANPIDYIGTVQTASGHYAQGRRRSAMAHNEQQHCAHIQRSVEFRIHIIAEPASVVCLCVGDRRYELNVISF